jgi:peptidoglycan/LPS O-acetylase OafA/YrhL
MGLTAETRPVEEPTAHVVERIRGLDGLRGLASLPVLLFHCDPRYFPGGYFALDLFFVMSGYIISLTLLTEHSRTGTISIADFYRRRAFRLLPAMFAVAAAVLMLGWLAGDAWAPQQSRREEWAEAAMAVTSTMNWFAAFGVSPLGFLAHTWSLSLEEQFYLLWPLALLLLLRARKARSAAAVLVGLALICVAWRAYLASAGAAPERLYLGTDTRFDALMLGCLLAVIGTAAVPRAVRRWWPIPASGFVLLLFLSTWRQPWLGYGGFTLIALLAFWLIAAVVEGERVPARFLELKPFQWLGARSYSLYLWQVPMIGVVGLCAVPRPYAPAAIFIFSLVAAAISYRLLERPFLRRRSRPVAVTPSASPAP